jgi:hypothetical protein
MAEASTYHTPPPSEHLSLVEVVALIASRDYNPEDVWRELIRAHIKGDLRAGDRQGPAYFRDLPLKDFIQRAGLAQADIDAIRSLSRNGLIPPESWRYWEKEGSILKTGGRAGDVLRLLEGYPYHGRTHRLFFEPFLLRADVLRHFRDWQPQLAAEPALATESAEEMPMPEAEPMREAPAPEKTSGVEDVPERTSPSVPTEELTSKERSRDQMEQEAIRWLLEECPSFSDLKWTEREPRQVAEVTKRFPRLKDVRGLVRKNRPKGKSGPKPSRKSPTPIPAED